MADNAALHRAARVAVVKACEQKFGRSPSTFAAQCYQAIGFYETNYGTSWGNASHNWGAVQATKAQVNAGVPTFMWIDHLPDNTPYPQAFLSYPDDVAGARSMIDFAYAAAGKEIDRGESTDDVWAALYYGHYYGARCPNAQAKYGAGIRSAFAFSGKRATDEAGKACEIESIKQGQDLAARDIQEIAAALGETPAPRAGGGSVIGTLARVGALGAIGYLVWRYLL